MCRRKAGHRTSLPCRLPCSQPAKCTHLNEHCIRILSWFYLFSLFRPFRIHSYFFTLSKIQHLWIPSVHFLLGGTVLSSVCFTGCLNTSLLPRLQALVNSVRSPFWLASLSLKMISSKTKNVCASYILLFTKWVCSCIYFVIWFDTERLGLDSKLHVKYTELVSQKTRRSCQ